MTLTPREKHVAAIAGLTVILLILFHVDQQTLNDYELLWLIFYIFPLGLCLITDPQRRQV